MKVHNFSAGPAILPETVLEQARAAIDNFDNTQLSILEVSHRSKGVENVMNEAQEIVKRLLGLGDEYAVLFLTGGASSQFYMAPMNLLNENQTAAYIDTGAWSTKAIKEAKAFGNVDVVASSADTNFSYIPRDYTLTQDHTYVHLTSNNTIFGTQFHSFPETDAMVVADMSSDIFCRPIDANAFDLIYAGAQKNLGPAGTTLVIIKKEILGKVNRHIPTMLNYETHIKKNSSFNTPPVYPIYVCMLTLRWIEANGGLEAMHRLNKEKADLLYDEIDTNPYFKGTARVEDRSLMNATFVMEDESLQDLFLQYCTANQVSGIKGHRSVGGFRASIYNAMSLSSVQHLVDLMQGFKA